MKRRATITSLFLLLAACAHVDRGQPAGKRVSPSVKRKAATVTVVTRKRRERPLPSVPQPPYQKGVRGGAVVAAYDVGATVDAQGNLVGPHRDYHVVQSAHWHLRFPWGKDGGTAGPPGTYSPSNYRPVPLDQRMKDELADLEKAKRELQDANAEVRQRLNEIDPLKEKIAEEEEQKRALQARLDQLNQQMGVRASSLAAPLSGPAAAGAAAADANDPLKTWGQ
jgi:hypothetical protein